MPAATGGRGTDSAGATMNGLAGGVASPGDALTNTWKTPGATGVTVIEEESAPFRQLRTCWLRIG